MKLLLDEQISGKVAERLVKALAKQVDSFPPSGNFVAWLQEP